MSMRARFLLCLVWIFWKIKFISEKDYWNWVFLIKAFDSGLKVRTVDLGDK